MRGRLAGLLLLFGVVAFAVFIVGGRSASGYNETAKPKPYLRVGHSFRTYTGQADIIGDVTAFTGVRVKELKLGVVVLKGGKETVVDERRFMVGESHDRPPPNGVVSLQFVPIGKGKDRRYELVMGGGIADAANRIPESTRKPNAVTVERPPLSHDTRLGDVAAGMPHVVRVDIIEGEITEERAYVVKGNSLSNKILKEKTLSLDRLKELSGKAEKETIIATTIWWKGYD